jgi:anti-sigma B factor antagonist
MVLLKPSITILRETQCQGVVVLLVTRELLEPHRSPLKTRIDELVTSGCKSIVIDLQRFLDVDSSDIGRLIRAHLSVRRAGGRIHLCNLAQKVSTLLSVTRLNTVFAIHGSLEESISAFR